MNNPLNLLDREIPAVKHWKIFNHPPLKTKPLRTANVSFSQLKRILVTTIFEKMQNKGALVTALCPLRTFDEIERQQNKPRGEYRKILDKYFEFSFV